jgi:hypothetical protein
MPFPHFVGVVRYSNPLLLSRELYPPIEVPEGVVLVDPMFTEGPELVRKRGNGVAGMDTAVMIN